MWEPVWSSGLWSLVSGLWSLVSGLRLRNSSNCLKDLERREKEEEEEEEEEVVL